MRIQEIKKLQENIVHIEDLPLSEFIFALKNLDHYEISEKIDGANIQFGIDETGFYTSREGFGGQKVYKPKDYQIAYNTTFLRSAHIALEAMLPELKSAGLTKGDRVEAEVLYGSLPNAIRYTTNENRLIFLRVVEGNVKLSSLRETLLKKKTTSILSIPYTEDGKNINSKLSEDIWSFEQTPILSANLIDSKVKAALTYRVSALESYLDSKSGLGDFTNREIEMMTLNRKYAGLTKESIKFKKAEIENYLNESSGPKSQIKSMLLDELVRKTKSAFGPELNEGGWIEGVVFKNTNTGKMFKLVDKEIFSNIKNFLWEVRNSLTENPKSVNLANSFLGNILVQLGSSLGHPELGTVHATRYLKKLGLTQDEILESFKHINFLETKKFWADLLSTKKIELGHKLVEYLQTKDSYTKTISFGKDALREFRYDEEINNRTLQVFSTLYQKLDDMETQVSVATHPKHLILAFLEKQISKI